MDFGSSRYADPDANTYSDGYNDASAESYTNYDCERNTDLYSAA